MFSGLAGRGAVCGGLSRSFVDADKAGGALAPRRISATAPGQESITTTRAIGLRTPCGRKIQEGLDPDSGDVPQLRGGGF